MSTSGMGCGRTVGLAVVILGLLSAAAMGDPVKTGGKGVKIPFKNYMDGDVLHITTTGTATGTNPPPTIAEHVVQVQATNIKNGSFTVPAQDKDSTGKVVNVRDYDIQVVPMGPDGYKSLLDVESLFPDGSDLNQNSVGDELSHTLGDGVELRLPLFSADDGTFLYAMVNIAAYIPGNVEFSAGQQFAITNGMNPSLPGMVFGSSQILLDSSSANGFGNPNAFNGTLTVAGENDPSAVAVPLPSSALGGTVLLAGVVALRSWRWNPKGILRGS